VDGVHPLLCVVCGMAVGVLMLLSRLSRGAVRALPIPVQYSSVLRSCHATVSCHVLWRVGGEYLSVLFVWWGILRSLPHLTVVEGVAIVDGGWHV
jgi:hypothetical protein